MMGITLICWVVFGLGHGVAAVSEARYGVGRFSMLE